MNPVAYHHQAETHEYETPQALFDGLNVEFRFGLDVCATAENAKCAKHFTKDDDGLAQSWTGTCWMNPPYGREIARWMRKAFEESQKGATVVCLVPARTDAGWWHDYAMRGEIRFIRGRLRFSGANVNAPFPSAIVVFRPCAQRVVSA